MGSYETVSAFKQWFDPHPRSDPLFWILCLTLILRYRVECLTWLCAAIMDLCTVLCFHVELKGCRLWTAEEQVVMSIYFSRFQAVVTRSTFKFREIWCSLHPAVVQLHVCDGTGIIWCPHQCLPVASQIYWTHRLQETQPIVGLIYSLLQMLDFSPPTLRYWQLGNDV